MATGREPNHADAGGIDRVRGGSGTNNSHGALPVLEGSERLPSILRQTIDQFERGHPNGLEPLARRRAFVTSFDMSITAAGDNDDGGPVWLGRSPDNQTRPRHVGHRTFGIYGLRPGRSGTVWRRSRPKLDRFRGGLRRGPRGDSHDPPQPKHHPTFDVHVIQTLPEPARA